MLTDQVITPEYALYHGDSAEVFEKFPDQSVHMWLYSPPFATESGGALYNYSSSDRDLSNARTYDEFFQHYGYIVEQTHRLLIPGRISAVHCMDVPKKGANVAGYTDFPGAIVKLHEKMGFEMLPRICIWKEPLAVRTRTMAKALTHRQITEDSCLNNVAGGDYLIPFRKRGDNPVPVSHPNGLLDYAGSRDIPSDVRHLKGYEGNQIKNRYSHWIWRQYASCFWDDIRLERTLPYKEGRDEKDERHMHPLQLDVIDRCCTLWTNPGETVATPFMGVGSEVYGAVLNGRRGVGCELKESYYNQATANVPKALDKVDAQGGLFV